MFKLKKLFNKIVLSLGAVALLLGLASCGKIDKDKTQSKITDTCKLTIDYEGKDFLEDGIGTAKLSRIADGDTASFELPSGSYVTIRFFGIDTPESTGDVDKWGVSASKFTKAQINKDSEFVLESSTGDKPEHDSYGTRYLGYVWYRNSSDEDWKNLNLLIVENGYSKSTIQNAPKYLYYSYFKKAEDFAKKNLMHIWSNDDDPNYSDEAVSVNLKQLNEQIEDYWNMDTQTGSKIRLEVMICELTVSESGTHTFVAAQVIDGHVYKYNVYTGYASAAVSAYLKIGNSYDITGFVQNYNGDYQISGLNYVLGEMGEGYTSLAGKESFLTFDSSIEYITRYDNNLKSNATVKTATLDGTTLTLTVSAYTNSKDGFGEEPVDYTIKVNVSESYDLNKVLNKTMTGCVYKNGDSYVATGINALSFR